MAERIKVIEAAAIMHVSQQFVRVGLQQGQLPIGTAVKTSSQWTYFISEKLLEEFTGADVKKELMNIRKLTA